MRIIDVWQLDFRNAPSTSQRRPFSKVLEDAEPGVLGFKIFGSWKSEVIGFLLSDEFGVS